MVTRRGAQLLTSLTATVSDTAINKESQIVKIDRFLPKLYRSFRCRRPANGSSRTGARRQQVPVLEGVANRIDRFSFSSEVQRGCLNSMGDWSLVTE
ncbi:unnamed protein product [Gadus morhua 'NCC']